MSDNMVNYAQDVLDTFEERAFHAVDSLILSWVSYMHFPQQMKKMRDWEGVRLKEVVCAEYFQEMLADLWNPEGSRQLLYALAASPRFRNITVCGFEEQLDKEQEKQFAAMTFRLGPGLSYVAFRGTDATLVGWKEDFNMAFQCPVPAQTAAVQYLERAAAHCRGMLMLGGHSKGGNLSVYSAAKCSGLIQGRIKRVYSHDGPGFLEQVLNSEEFERVLPIVEKTLPQSSLVGMLLENQEDFQVVKSSSLSLWQHDPFSWVLEDGRFCVQNELKAGARFRDETLNEWIRQLSKEERERFVDVLFEIIEVNGIDTIPEFGAEWKKSIPAAINKISKLDADTRELVFGAVGKLAALGLKNFPEIFRKGKSQQYIKNISGRSEEN